LQQYGKAVIATGRGMDEDGKSEEEADEVEGFDKLAKR
jgi:hypothetical protein